MAGIYIPGVELPTGCGGCFFLLECDICSMMMAADYKHKSIGDYRWKENERHPECPLIPIPNHGRLGDLDAMAAKDTADYVDAMRTDITATTKAILMEIHMAVRQTIAAAETIIPADIEIKKDQ